MIFLRAMMTGSTHMQFTFVHCTCRLAITMPMSLANTESLAKCKQLRELLLCALPTQLLGTGSMAQVSACRHIHN